MLCALIMAGEKELDFGLYQQMKTESNFLNLIDETMIQMTVNRIKPSIPFRKNICMYR